MPYYYNTAQSPITHLCPFLQKGRGKSIKSVNFLELPPKGDNSEINLKNYLCRMISIPQTQLSINEAQPKAVNKIAVIALHGILFL